jgi:hypothetical protein
MRVNQICPSQIQIEPNPGLIGQSPAKENQINPWISFAESSLIKALRRPPGALFVAAPLPASKEATDGGGAALFARA